MSTTLPIVTEADAHSLAAKLATFGAALSESEQALLWAALHGPDVTAEVSGYSFSWSVSSYTGPTNVNGGVRVAAGDVNGDGITNATLIGLLLPAVQRLR